MAAGQGAQTPRPPGHHDAFDAYRAVAVLSVVALHFLLHNQARMEGWLWSVLIALSAYGVPIFFIISGYLLAESYHNLERACPRPWVVRLVFMVRRVARIYPAYLVALVLLWLLSGSGDAVDLAVHALNLHNLFTDYSRSINDVFWSLAVEFQWYLTAPFLIPLLLSVRPRTAVALTLLLLLASVLYRNIHIAQYLSGAIGEKDYLRLENDQLVIHLFSFLLGVLAYRHRGPVTVPPWPLALALFVLSWCWIGLVRLSGDGHWAAPAEYSHNLYYPGQILLTLLILRLREWRFGGPLSAVQVRFVSRVSYSLYIWHLPVLLWIRPYRLPLGLELAAYLAAALAVAALSYYLVEQWGTSARMRDWQRAFLRRRRAAKMAA